MEARVPKNRRRHFTKEEVKYLVYNMSCETTKEDDWSGELRLNSSIVNLDGRFYELDWEQGLNGNQDDVFYHQDALEVEQVEITIPETIVKIWRLLER